MTNNISSSKVATSLAFKFLEKITVKALGLVIGVVLARILSPNDFGVVAVLMAVVAIAQSIVDSGLSTALVQAKIVDEEDYSTIFYISMGIAIGLYVILFFLSPLIAAFYDISTYIIHFRIVLLILFFYALNSIQGAMLTRELKFFKMFLLQLIASIISGILGVSLAVLGFGIWSLVVYYLSHSVVVCIAYFCVTKWIPRHGFSKKKAKKLFGFGFKIFLSGILTSLFANIRTFIIGKLFSTKQLGLYSRGEQIPSIISTTVDSAFNSVMLPVFSKEQDNVASVQAMLKKTISLHAYLNFPMMMGLYAVAYPLVYILFGEKWLLCVPYLKVLSLANLTVSIIPPCLVAIKSIGRSDIILKLETVRRIIMLIILGVSLLFNSLIAVAIGWLISTFVDLIVVLFSTKKVLNYTLLDVIKDLLPIFIISILMTLVVMGVGFINANIFVKFGLQVLTGVMIYLLISLITKNSALLYLFDFAGKLLRKK